MFPLTHIEVAINSLGKINRQVILGSLFPDFAVFLGIGRNQAHLVGLDFYDYCVDNYPDHLDFAKGIISHSSFAPGVDYYADEGYAEYNMGYCFQKAQLIKDRVKGVCHLPEHMSLWKSHNFMEMAFELVTKEHHPNIGEIAYDALPKDGDIFCGKVLSDYYNKDNGMIDAMYRKVAKHFAFRNVTPLSLAEKYRDSLSTRHNIDGLDVVAMSEIIAECYNIIKPDYDEFMNMVISKQIKFYNGL